VREERKYLQSLAESKSLRRFANAAEAQRIIGTATRREFQTWWDGMKIKYDAINSDGGTK
jgi:hypothetical protein